MALRLTDSSSPAPAATDLALLDRARTALAVGHLDGFRALPAEAAALTDPHRRYVVRRSLVDLGLRDLRRPGADQPRVLAATAHVALEILAATPAEPVLLNLAGVALFELGSLPGATALLQAAARLDPQVAGLDANLARVERLRRARQTLVPHASIASAVPALERRARAVGAAARPADRATISLCMIVRDEAATLGRALASAQDVVDEIVVVDTGSTDRTADIARAHGARVLTHAWDDDFAAARNAGLDAATGDWILVLDADEELVADDAARLRTLARRTWREGYLLTIVNRVGRERSGVALTQDVLRMVRNRPEHRFEGRVHEGVLHALPADAPERLEPAGVRIAHDGYLDAARASKDKSARNLELLGRQLREGAPTPYLHFNIGSELLAAGDAGRAVEHLDAAWGMLDAPARVTYGSALAARRALALRAAGRPAEAARAAGEAVPHFDGYTDLVLEQALASEAAGDLDAAETLLRRCLELGDAPSRYAGVTGAGTVLAAGALTGVLLRAGRVDDALAAAPGTLPAATLEVLARALDTRLAATDVDGFVALLPLVDRIDDLGARERRELLAQLYLTHGFLDSAADEWAAACDEHGPDAAALTGLSRIAAARGDTEDAELFAEGARELAAQAA